MGLLYGFVVRISEISLTTASLLFISAADWCNLIAVGGLQSSFYTQRHYREEDYDLDRTVFVWLLRAGRRR